MDETLHQFSPKPYTKRGQVEVIIASLNKSTEVGLNKATKLDTHRLPRLDSGKVGYQERLQYGNDRPEVFHLSSPPSGVECNVENLTPKRLIQLQTNND